jgi:hypothetical protein
MGGTDDPNNIIEVTVEEHAELHRRLYEAFGYIEDKVAWMSLIGQAKDPEVWRLKSKLGAAVANKDGGPTLGTHWYHNPEDPTQQLMLKECPEGWVKGRGKYKSPDRSNYKASEKQRRVASETARKMGKANAKECTVRGMTFPSRVKAAKYFGVTPPCIRLWKKNEQQ